MCWRTGFLSDLQWILRLTCSSADAGGATAAIAREALPPRAVLTIYICREGFRCSGEASARVITETRKLGIAVLQRGQLVQFCPSLTMLTRAL